MSCISTKRRRERGGGVAVDKWDGRGNVEGGQLVKCQKGICMKRVEQSAKRKALTTDLGKFLFSVGFPSTLSICQFVALIRLTVCLDI